MIHLLNDTVINILLYIQKYNAFCIVYYDKAGEFNTNHVKIPVSA